MLFCLFKKEKSHLPQQQAKVASSRQTGWNLTGLLELAWYLFLLNLFITNQGNPISAPCGPAEMVRGPLMSGCPRFAVASGKGPCRSQDCGEYFMDWTVALRKEVVPRHQERRDEDVPAVVTPICGLSHCQAIVCKPSEFS